MSSLIAMTLDEWKEYVKKQSCLNQHSRVRFTDPNAEGRVYALWVGVNPHVEPTLGVYFTKDDREIKAGTGWAHE